MTEETPLASGWRTWRGWRLLRLAAWVSFALQVLGVPVAFFGAYGAAWALGVAGMALLRGIVAYGIHFRARWAVWIGAFLAVISVSAPFVAFQVNDVRFANTVLDWGDCLVNVAYLVALVQIRRARSQPGAP